MNSERGNVAEWHKGEPRDPEKPLTVSLVVQPTDDLLRLQAYFQEHFALTPQPPESLHITLIYVGKPDELYREMCEVLDIKRDTFEKWLRALMCELSALVPSDGPAPYKSLDVSQFGDTDNPVLVLRVELSREVAEARAEMFERFIQALTEIGIEDPLAFMENSNLFRFQYPTYNPHITLGKIETESKEI